MAPVIKGSWHRESFGYNSIEKSVTSITYRPALQQLLITIVPEATASDVNLHKQWKLSLYGHEISLSEATHLATIFQIADSQLPAAVPAWSGGETLTVSLSEGVNVAATGAPTIDDTTPQVGETLNADITGISDANGLTSPTFAYQWISNDGSTDTPISGETNSSYTVVAGDVGNTIKVEVTFTDDDGFEETLESAPTAAVVTAATTVVTVAAGTTQVTEGTDAEFILTRSGTPTADLPVNVSAADTPSGAYISGTPDTSVTFTGTNTTVTYTVNTDPDSTHEAHGSITATVGSGTGYTVGADSSATVAVLDNDNSPAMGQPTISGTFRVGETLMVDTSPISDDDGLTNPTFSYTWARVDSNDSSTPVGSGSTYTLVSADVGHTLYVLVGFSDAEGHAEGQLSANTAVVKAAEPTGTVLVNNTGKAKTSSNVALDTLNQKRAQSFETGANAGGYSVSTVSVRFHTVDKPTDANDQVAVKLYDESSGNPGAALCTLTNPAGIVSDDVTHFAAPSGCPDLAASTTYFIVLERTTADAANSVGLNVTLNKGQSGLSGWSIGDSRHESTGTWGSTSSDVFMVRVYGASLSATNTPATGEPAITGTARVGQTLTANTSGIMDADGLTNPGYTYQWIRVDSSNSPTNIGNDSSSYTIVAADLGSRIKVKVTFTDDANNSENLESDLTGTVAPPLPTVNIAEGTSPVMEGTDATFTLTRSGTPTGELTVNVGVTQNGNYIKVPAPSTVTFSGTETTALLRVKTDNDDADETQGSITATVGSGEDYVVGSDSSATVIVQDNDTPGVGVTRTSLALSEGSSDSYFVLLDTQPSADVTVNISKSGADPAAVSVSPPSLVFTSANWSIGQRVTVTALDDGDADNATASIGHAIAPGSAAEYASLTNLDSVAVSVADDETIAVRVSKSGLVIPEGAARTYHVRLGSQPGNSVTVSITKSGPDSGDVTVSPASLVFTTTNWEDRQEVTVTATADADTDADSATLAHSATSSDTDYSGISIPSVAVDITEAPPPTVDLTIGTTKGWAVVDGKATYPEIDMDRAFEVTITFSEAVTGFEKHDVYAGYLGGPSVGISGELTVVSEGLVYRGRVDKLVDGLLEVLVDTGGQTPIIATDGRQASVGGRRAASWWTPPTCGSTWTPRNPAGRRSVRRSGPAPSPWETAAATGAMSAAARPWPALRAGYPARLHLPGKGVHRG